MAFLLATAGFAAAQAGAHTRTTHTTTKKTTKVTVINVLAGKPSELAFKLSKFSNLPAGTFTFKVKDVGVAFHDFKICIVPTKTAKNACVGKATKILKPGQTATLTVKLTKKGTYAFLCTVPGHAAAGMKGLLGVGVVVKATTKPAATTPTTTAATTTTATTTTATTTTTAAPPSTTTTTASSGDSCPGGVDIPTYLQNANSAGDRDGDDSGAPSDNDGCL